MKRVVGMLIAFAMSAGVVNAASCESNFKTSGVPMVTAVSYKTWQELPKAKAAVVLKTLAQAVAAEGFSGIEINRELSTIDAYQETTGSGRVQTLRVVARQKGAGVRVDAIFDIQAGQVTSNNVVRTGLCNIVNSVSR
ncbi:hypothetical protein [Rhizobium sp. ICMP 5592]|uniref:hypothetical protein n=1 Tax=Rhizobium sp. ICMP 5592 TaxID=2292445 RepID=UPI0012957F7B|nr:hypothetical protein [Rhizobium sp. ICMP 5592]MQB40320.1 hypothetical protein [Rhizobium sp. ICMP 5592]